MHADQLPITGPCPIDLDAIGFDRSAKVAHCSHCTKSVHVLSNMTRAEARRFLRDNKGKKLCVSYSRDQQGRVRFEADAPTVEPSLVPVTRLKPRSVPSRARASRAAGLVAALGITAAAACTPHGEPPREHDGVVAVEKAEPPKTEPTPREVIPVPPPEEITLAGAAVIPEEIVDGEMEVPDPDLVELDQPCDGKAEPRADRPRGMQPL